MSLLVSIDFSFVTEAQLDIVETLAGPNREIHLLHVTEPDPSFVGLAAGPEDVQQQVAKEIERAHDELGLTGFNMIDNASEWGLPSIHEEHWDPLWARAEERGTDEQHDGTGEDEMAAL